MPQRLDRRHVLVAEILRDFLRFALAAHEDGSVQKLVEHLQWTV